jgi:hypothetical protein
VAAGGIGQDGDAGLPDGANQGPLARSADPAHGDGSELGARRFENLAENVERLRSPGADDQP